MKDPMRRRIPILRAGVPTLQEDFIYGVEPLSQQLRHARFGGLPVDQEKAPDSYYDEDDSSDVDPMSNPSLDRFERTEQVASQISSRMKSKHKDKLDHAES